MRKYPNVRAEMARHSMTVRELAVELKLSTTGLSNRLNGKTEWSLTEGVRLVDIFNAKGSTVEVKTLFGE
jgi:hypothetical protein